MRLLVPDDLTEDCDDGRRYVDGQAPAQNGTREARTIIDCIERFADVTPPPVVLYDGPLVRRSQTRSRRKSGTRTTVSRCRWCCLASQHHGVPVVGYGRERQHEPGETAAPAVPGRVR